MKLYNNNTGRHTMNAIENEYFQLQSFPEILIYRKNVIFTSKNCVQCINKIFPLLPVL